jgi:putative glutamine amidotransferase
MQGSMVPEEPNRPRVGIPWRTTEEQRKGIREKLDYYFQAVRKAGAEPVEISLEQAPGELESQLKELDAFVLPGSPADVDPARYGASKQDKTKSLDANRDRTDATIISHALERSKPLLAICYGCQILNVCLHGSLIQDISSEKPGALAHGQTDLPPGERKGDIRHPASIASESRLAKINGAIRAEINSSHHQAIDKVGENLRITARAPDDIVEGVEWMGDSNWVVGVQWHPERMGDDVFAKRLFGDFAHAASKARGGVIQKA